MVSAKHAVSDWAKKRTGFLWLVPVFFAALLFSRHPGALLRPEFWGEDGWVWYPDAYTRGWPSLLLPHTGYLQTISRLGALAAQAFPISSAPLVFAVIAFLVQLSPPLFLISPRFASVWPEPSARLAFALLYVVLPNSFETSVNLTNAQWHLSILAFLVLAAEPPRSIGGVMFDTAVLLLCGLSGPFVFFLLPIAVWQAFQGGTRCELHRFVLLALAAIVQGAFLVHFIGTRTPAPLGVSVNALLRILSLNVILGAELGQRLMGHVQTQPAWTSTTILPLMAVALGVALSLYALWSGPDLVRKACLFAALCLGAALLSPQITDAEPQWQAMTQVGSGNRYYLIPMLAWGGVCFALAASRAVAARLAGRALITLMLVGIVVDWSYPYMPRTTFKDSAKQFQAAEPGESVRFPIHPPGMSPMILVK